MSWRTESASKAPKRETRFLPALMSIHTHVWRAVFGKAADAIEKSVENSDECKLSHVFLPIPVSRVAAKDMIIDNDPPITRNISVPRDMSSLSCSSFTAGIVEAVLDGLGFVRYTPYALTRTPSNGVLPTVRTRHCAQHAQRPIPQPNHNPNQAREVRPRARGSAQDVITLAHVHRAATEPWNLLPKLPRVAMRTHRDHPGQSW